MPVVRVASNFTLSGQTTGPLTVEVALLMSVNGVSNKPSIYYIF